jgi:hypothetical protein
MFSATASATSSATSTATGNTMEEAVNNANTSANTSAYYSLIHPSHPSPDQKSCEKFVLSCIDFRFIDDYGNYMNVLGNSNNYDQFILAGSSLGYNGIPGYENWIPCCDQHIELAPDLHSINTVIIFDHLDCGAYGLVYTPEELAGDGEFKLHVKNLNTAEKTLREKYPFLVKVNKIIFDLDYKPITIP